MANQVYANNMEVSCKSANGKAVACFPDVCFTPPLTPATPPGVPIPYPNTGMASDTTNGSRTVKITGKEAMLKNKSYFKTSYGDEAGCAPKKGVLTSKIKGKVYFTSWSMDVKFEGENVVRHMDMTTHNHASPPGNTAPWMYMDEMSISANGGKDKCANERRKIAADCTDAQFEQAGPPPLGDCPASCCEAKKCALAKKSSNAGNMKCCNGKTKHHIIPDHCFKSPGSGGYYEGVRDMSYNEGLCICASGHNKSSRDPASGNLLTHGKIHDDFDRQEDWYRDNNNKQWNFGEANEAAADVCSFHTGCDPECLKQQTKEFYKSKGVHPKTTLRADSGGRQTPPVREEMGNNRVFWSS
ncbi:MAG TPA: DUF4150 domain-containing protein [Pseudomonas sp.]|nr:DUF4150 domain-containing protein [Pseudomonas sp.]